MAAMKCRAELIPCADCDGGDGGDLLRACRTGLLGASFVSGLEVSRPSFTVHRLTTRPAGALYALESASLGMHNAQTEAFDKLYAAEFKRFIAGKIVCPPLRGRLC